ncbi:MAG TPA: IS110 family transposase [Acidimicrobiales bacterium]|nr:IS110 family transposase [Acidimicrobiales bacterium]
MSMVCGLDLHRGQITFDCLMIETSEVWRGRIWQPDRARFRRWLREELAPRANGEAVAVAVEGCTGWRYVVEEVTAAGWEAHVAEPADTQAKRGRKKRAKTDRADARLQRELLQKGELPESWIPPTPVLEWRERTVLYKSLLDQRRVWIQRIHAELFQHGVALPEGEIPSPKTRAWLAGEGVELSPAASQRLAAGYRMLDATDAELVPLRKEIDTFGRRQPACQALAKAHYGIGPLTAVFVWVELGDCRRFSRSMQVVRLTGLDVLVDSSDNHRAGGYLCRQGPPTLRWALFEAGKCAARAGSPDYDYYQSVKRAHDGKLAAIATARKITRRCYHTLRSLDSEVVYTIPTA